MSNLDPNKFEDAIKISEVIANKKNSGKDLLKGEKVILTLAEKCKSTNNRIDSELCETIINFYNDRLRKTDSDIIEVNSIELQMILDAISERL